MGFDWIIGGKARPGSEATFLKLVRRKVAGEPIEDYALQAVSLPARACVGAPRIGIDPIADAYVLQKVRANAGDEVTAHLPVEEVNPEPDSEAEAALLLQAAGVEILALAPVQDGLPVYTSAGLFPGVDETSFQGDLLDDLVDVIGPELARTAPSRKMPDSLATYGFELLQRARTHAQQHGCIELEYQREPPHSPEDSPEANVHIVFAAAKWCLYWGSRGHWLDITLDRAAGPG